MAPMIWARFLWNGHFMTAITLQFHQILFANLNTKISFHWWIVLGFEWLTSGWNHFRFRKGSQSVCYFLASLSQSIQLDKSVVPLKVAAFNTTNSLSHTKISNSMTQEFIELSLSLSFIFKVGLFFPLTFPHSTTPPQEEEEIMERNERSQQVLLSFHLFFFSLMRVRRTLPLG